MFLSPVLGPSLSAAAVSGISSTCETLSPYNQCWVNTQSEEQNNAMKENTAQITVVTIECLMQISACESGITVAVEEM